MWRTGSAPGTWEERASRDGVGRCQQAAATYLVGKQPPRPQQRLRAHACGRTTPCPRAAPVNSKIMTASGMKNGSPRTAGASHIAGSFARKGLRACCSSHRTQPAVSHRTGAAGTGGRANTGQDRVPRRTRSPRHRAPCVSRPALRRHRPAGCHFACSWKRCSLGSSAVDVRHGCVGLLGARRDDLTDTARHVAVRERERAGPAGARRGVARGPYHAAGHARHEQQRAAGPEAEECSLDRRLGPGHLPRTRRDVPQGRRAKVGAQLLLWHRLALRASPAGRVRTLSRDVWARARAGLRRSRRL